MDSRIRGDGKLKEAFVWGAPTDVDNNEAGRGILRSRARELALVPSENPAGELLEIVEFSLAHERYGIESHHISEVCMIREFAPIPCTPHFVLGVVNLRGRIVSVIDLKKFYSFPERGFTNMNKIIFLRSSAMEFGIVADDIRGVRHVIREELQHELPTLSGLRREYLLGVAADQTIILDAEKLLADHALVVDEQP